MAVLRPGLPRGQDLLLATLRMDITHHRIPLDHLRMSYHLRHSLSWPRSRHQRSLQHIRARHTKVILHHTPQHSQVYRHRNPTLITGHMVAHRPRIGILNLARLVAGDLEAVEDQVAEVDVCGRACRANIIL